MTSSTTKDCVAAIFGGIGYDSGSPQPFLHINPTLTNFALEPIYGSLLLAIAMTAIAIAVILLVTPKSLDPSKRRWLLIARMTAAAMLILACFGPSLVRTDRRPADATLVVALDTSKSMTLADSDKVSRLQTQIQSAKQLADGLVGLDETLTIKWLAYDSEARELAEFRSDEKSNGNPSLTFLDELEAAGRSTDLSAAAMSSITLANGQPIAGVVMFGDGTQTAASEAGGASRVIRTLDSIGVPLWTIPIGPAEGESATRDVAIEGLRESYQLFAGNEAEVSFRVISQGLASRDLPVRLFWEDESGKREEVAIRTARPEQASDAVAMSIPITAPEAGTYRLIASADVQQGERLTTNNEQIAFVEVLEGGGRIFYLEGSLRQEYVFLRRSLRRFPDLDLTARWIPSDTRSSWPIDLSEHLRPGKYDIVIIGDLPATALGEDQLSQLADLVDAGAGLLLLGGPNAYSGGGYQSTILADVMPVDMAQASQDQPDGKRQVMLLPSTAHPITRLGNQSVLETWKGLPDQLGASPWASAKVAPGIEVILEDASKQPMMVLGGYGKGRVVAIAFDSTWRWWRSGQSNLHRRFWRQVMLWLLSRDNLDEDQILVELDAMRFDAADPPNFIATATGFLATANEQTDKNQQPIQLVAQVIGKDGKERSLEDVVSRTGSKGDLILSGSLPENLPAGSYQLTVSSDSGAGLKPGKVSFQVIDQSIEMSRPMADPVFLTQLADQTADQGGRAFRPTEMNALIDTIASRRKKSETPVVEKSRLGDGPRTGWPLFLIFAIALSIEWYLRRQWNLA